MNGKKLALLGAVALVLGVLPALIVGRFVKGKQAPKSEQEPAKVETQAKS
jgi:hypothetical protein